MDVDIQQKDESMTMDGKKLTYMDFLSGYLRSFSRAVDGYKWFIFGFGAACCYSCMALTAQSLSEEIGTMELVTMRAFVSASLSAIVMLYNGTKPHIHTKRELACHSANSFFLALGTFCQFYAYQNMPAADATAILYGYVAFIGILARVFLKESFRWFEAAVVIVAFLGIVLVARPPFLFQLFNDTEIPYDTQEVVPPLVALAGALSIAMVIVTLRAMSAEKINVMKMVLYANLSMGLVFTIFTTVLNEWLIPQCSWVRFRVLLVGLSGFLAYALSNYALSFEKAVYVSLVFVNDFFIVFFLSVAFFGFRPEWTSIVGALLIIGSTLAVFLKKIYARRGLQRGNEDVDEDNVFSDNCSTHEGMDSGVQTSASARDISV